MNKAIFLAGGTGAIGRRLIPLLIAEGWHVVCTTRSADKARELREFNVEAKVVDVYDAQALITAVGEAKPDTVIHQLTDLPSGLDPSRMEEATARNARIRDEGTRNLVDAAVRAGAQRIVAQSVAFAYAEAPLPHGEDDALAVNAEGRTGVSARGVASLERQLMTAPLIGIVLRYGRLYGPGTGFDRPAGPAPLHVDAAAKAAALAVTRGASGVYNLAEDDGTVNSQKAKRELEWTASWRNNQ